MTSNGREAASGEFDRPQDVLVIGDSMIRRLNVYGHPQRVWKYCYPGATVEELHTHILTEILPGEALIGTVVVNIGTNDISRSRNRYRSVKDVFECLKLFLIRLSRMYPQALIMFVNILPRLDCDNDRVTMVNSMMLEFILARENRFDRYDFSDSFKDVLGSRRIPKKEYFRDTSFDAVHLSSSGTQVQQDAFNRLFSTLPEHVSRLEIDRTLLMWQSQWEHFVYWNLKTSDVRRSDYLDRKRLTNFTSKQRNEVMTFEKVDSRREFFYTDRYI